MENEELKKCKEEVERANRKTTKEEVQEELKSRGSCKRIEKRKLN